MFGSGGVHMRHLSMNVCLYVCIHVCIYICMDVYISTGTAQWFKVPRQ